MINFSARFTVCGKTFGEVDLLPLVGVSLIVGIVLLISATTFH